MNLEEITLILFRIEHLWIRNPYFYQFRCHHPLITTLAQMLQRFILFWKSSTQVIHSFNENSSLKTCVTLYALSRWPQHLLMFALISDVFFGSKTYLLGDNVTRFAFATTPNNQIFFFENMMKFWIPKIYEFLDQSERVFKFRLQKVIIPKILDK